MQNQEQYIIDSNGNKSAVILSIDDYNELLEDLHDLAMIAERKNDETISLAEMEKRLSN